MGFVDFKLLDGRGGSTDAKATKYKRVWQIITDDNDTDEASVLIHPSLPEIGQAHPSDPYAFCISVSADEEFPQGDGSIWKATAEYDTSAPESEESDPIDFAPRYSWDVAEYEVNLDVDINDNPIVNTAGDKFDPTVSAIYAFPVLRVTRNQLVYDETIAYAFNNSVNSDTYRGATPGKLRCRITGFDNKHKDGTIYWTVNFEFTYNPFGWQKHIVSAGMNELSGGSKRHIQLKGQNITSPMALQSSGLACWDNDGASAGTPYIHTFTVYPSANFSSLGV